MKRNYIFYYRTISKIAKQPSDCYNKDVGDVKFATLEYLTALVVIEIANDWTILSPR